VSTLTLVDSKIKSDLHLLSSRIASLVKKNGFNFTFNYMKEAMRLTVQALSGSPSKSNPLKTRVKVDYTGFPTIIPLNLRKILREGQTSSFVFPQRERDIRAVLTVLSIYRVFSTKVKVDLSTIVEPLKDFSVETLSPALLKPAINDLTQNGKIRLTQRSISLIGGESAGPNSRKAIWGTEADACAFLHKPIFILYYLRFLGLRNLLFSIWFLLILVLSTPFYVVNLALGGNKADLGKLSVVYDQAGKARVIAILNW